MSEVTRWAPAAAVGDDAEGMVINDRGDYVLHEVLVAAEARALHMEHVANECDYQLAAVQARAERLEQTIARINALLERWTSERLEDTLQAAEHYGLDRESRLQDAWWIRELRAALEDPKPAPHPVTK